jgi:hypothetical protein
VCGVLFLRPLNCLPALLLVSSLPRACSGGADILSVIVYTLPTLASGPLVTASQIACYVFPIANLVTSIPVFAIIVRYNIVNTGILPLWAANVVAVALPWALSLFFYAGNQLTQVGEPMGRGLVCVAGGDLSCMY